SEARGEVQGLRPNHPEMHRELEHPYLSHPFTHSSIHLYPYTFLTNFAGLPNHNSPKKNIFF
ncbi:MAG: hypothetical protein MJZ20_04810, partial [Bacteroidaceae bacterium]|nr:hypothetical protein [Bacteroidaceae bacterium]